MKFPNRLGMLAALLLLVNSNSAVAYLDNFEFSSPWSPYPPGCATLIVPMPNFHTHAKTEVIFTGSISLWNMQNNIQFDVNVEILRVGCTEPNRSTILVSLTVPDNNDETVSLIPVPIVYGRIEGDKSIYSLRLAREPHTNMVTHDAILEGEKNWFFLDSAGIDGLLWCRDCWMSPSQYNGEFELYFDDWTLGFGNNDDPTALIPDYENQLQEDSLPMNARLSGVWVTPETPDQGFLISINEVRSLYAGPLVIFLSWNTFDDEGNLLWLTGTSSFPWGGSEVTMDLILVQNGQFLGTNKADRSIVGSIRLHAKSCAEIRTYFDLEAIALGSGEFILTRSFNLEPAGFACQDYERRQLY